MQKDHWSIETIVVIWTRTTRQSMCIYGLAENECRSYIAQGDPYLLSNTSVLNLSRME